MIILGAFDLQDGLGTREVLCGCVCRLLGRWYEGPVPLRKLVFEKNFWAYCAHQVPFAALQSCLCNQIRKMTIFVNRPSFATWSGLESELSLRHGISLDAGDTSFLR